MNAPAPALGVGARRWWALGAVMLAVLAVGLDATVLSVAIPTLATHMESRSAAPGVDWEQVFGVRARALQEDRRLTQPPTV